eukprot:tig00021572_g22387.t1
MAARARDRAELECEAELDALEADLAADASHVRAAPRNSRPDARGRDPRPSLALGLGFKFRIRKFKGADHEMAQADGLDAFGADLAM